MKRSGIKSKSNDAFDTKVSDTNISKTETFIREDREPRLKIIIKNLSKNLSPIPFQHFNRT